MALKEKAYKLLAIQEGITNSKAKDLIDRGIVTAGGKKIVIARGEISTDTVFKVKELPRATKIFEDDNILALNKPAHLGSEELEKEYKQAILLNRLDKETSGVILFAKNEEFRKKAIEEFKNHRVYKEYVAVVEGKIIDEAVCDLPITTIKGKVAKSKIDLRNGKSAKTTVYPLMVEGHKSKVKVVIETGRTHQIRVHLAYLGMPIIGDVQYGKPSTKVHRVLLHSKVTKIFDYTFEAPEPKEFRTYGF
ncbi:pseudouridine synthase family protein [Arcobacter sp. FWKO B]|uniref:pseudouridine synthase family protein n=1 Tax=Arcobacter sp. FWKO B TaxID=2593672 RepID=UPI0018A4A313|nr:RNA pseudouridine synthase [Arcobacter sp. FWKO B]QOG12036.1 RNA pseudouridine synthase [Arcobacter sp. FWKO B]